MSMVGFNKGDSSATYTTFRGGGLLANYDKNYETLKMLKVVTQT